MIKAIKIHLLSRGRPIYDPCHTIYYINRNLKFCEREHWKCFKIIKTLKDFNDFTKITKYFTKISGRNVHHSLRAIKPSRAFDQFHRK